MHRTTLAHRPVYCWRLAGQLGLCLALVLASPSGSSGPTQSSRASAEASVSANVLDPVSINGVLGSLFNVAELLAPLQGAASPNTGSVLIRLVNTVPALVGGGADGAGLAGGPSLGLLISGRGADLGGTVAMLNGLLAPLSGGILQRELVAAVTMTSETPGLEGLSSQPAREGDERVAIVVAFN